MIILRLRNVKNAKEIIEASSFVIKNPKEYKGHMQKLFQNTSAIHLEIGMGKGKFIYEMAKNNPHINFIGMEKYESVLVRAVQKIEENPLPNLRLLLGDAQFLNDFFAQELSCIYLNFSDPWPKKRHAMRRLTSPKFLSIYEHVFVNKKTIVQKTDNLVLFASSLKNISQAGYRLEEVSLDLASSDISNVETEYEMKFKNLGIKINYLKAEKD